LPPLALEALHGEVLARVAEHLGHAAVGHTITAVEPTDDGYLYGYDLVLASAPGVVEHQRVFIERASGKPRAGVLTVDLGPRGTFAVWLYPSDPDLPALREVVDSRSLGAVLTRLGHPMEPQAINVISYRPGRRAVVRVDGGTSHVYLKVVEPAKAASIAERHQQFRSSSLPVPRLLGWSADGLVAMSELPGVDAQSAVGRLTQPEAFLDQLEFLSALLAAVPAFNTARSSLVERIDWYVERVSSRLPDETERVRRIGAMIARCNADGRSYGYTAVTIHGDLHLGQLFVDENDPGMITGMLDIDTAGAGDPADDAAAFYGHIVALGETVADTQPEYTAACLRLAAAWRSRWLRNRNAGFASRASAIAATHLLGHALRPLASDADGVSRRLIDHAYELVSDW
jgi:aminoglycoside phosphotransferase (APT) family kinase protein